MYQEKNQEKPPVKIKNRFGVHTFILINHGRGDEMIQKKNGQALVEFVIILPIFIFMLFACIDFGKILYTQNNLESKMDDIITVYEKEKNVESMQEKLAGEKIELEKKEEEEYQNFIMTKKIDIITPGLNLILGSPYEAKVKRVIYNE